MRRRSAVRVLFEPTRSKVRSPRKRSSLTCRLCVDFANFIEEERPALGLFKAADALLMGPGKGAFFVPEEFAFQQGGGSAAQ